jgi:hypothetical protein
LEGRLSQYNQNLYKFNKMKNLLLRFPLALLILVEFLIFSYLLLSRKIPFGHDGFQYFLLQYYFLNNSIQNAEIAQWMPYMTHGTVANWWYYIQGSPLQSLWMLTGGLLKSVNFLYIYYSGIFVDLLFLTCGTWFLGGFFYQSTEAKLIATGTVAISCLWFDQPWFNLHLPYLLPLTIYFYLKFFDSHKASDLLIAGNISTLQLFGTLPYFAPVLSFTIFLFLTSYLLTHRDKAIFFWNYCLKNKWALPTFCLTLLVPLACCWILLKIGTGEIINYNLGRNLDGTVSLEGFLTYGKSGWAHWHEIFSGFSPALDFHIYFGIFPLAAILFFLTHKPKRAAVPILTTTVIFILFAEGTFFSKILYLIWPGMDYYRHLTSALPIAKIFLCLLSGFAVDHLINLSAISKNRILFVSNILLAGIIFTLFFYKFPSVFSRIRPSLKGLPSEPSIWTLSEVSSIFFGSAIIYLVAWIIFSFLFMYSDKKTFRKYLVWVSLLFTLIDLSYFQLSHSNRRLINLNPTQYQQLHFQPTPYLPSRTIEIKSTERAKAFHTYMESLTNISRSAYSTTESFLFQDTFSSPYLTDHWLRPLELLVRTGYGFSSFDISAKPPYIEPKMFIAPKNNKNILLASGVSRDKLVLFETAYPACSEEDASKIIRHPDYDGTQLILIDPDPSGAENKCQTSGQILVSQSEKPRHPPASHNQTVKVISFSSNTLHLEVENSLDNPKANWLYYADTWHPFWKAQVNGKDVKVFQANLAYKAVRLEPGTNRIEFQFGSQQYNLAALTISLNWLFLLGIAVVYSGRSFYRKA